MAHIQVFSQECVKLMEDLTPWGLDVFVLVRFALPEIVFCGINTSITSSQQDRLAGSRPLLALSGEILHRDGLVQRLKINPVRSCHNIASFSPTATPRVLVFDHYFAHLRLFWLDFALR
jgi:hypothetical protein